MSFGDKLKALFGKEMTQEEAYKTAVDKEFKRMETLRKAKGNRQSQIVECRIVMKDCRSAFEQTIRTERDIANKKKRSNMPVERERTRMREAAIGILVAEMAMLDLESISSEMDMNAAMNQMGKALKQLCRLDNSVVSISNTSRNFIDMFYPSFKSIVEGTENYTVSKKTRHQSIEGEAQDISALYEIPMEVRNRIDEDFVDNMMAGDSYQMAMFKATHMPAKKVSEDLSENYSEDRAAFMARINALADQVSDDAVDIYATNPGDK